MCCAYIYIYIYIHLIIPIILQPQWGRICGRTALMLASERGHADTVRVLVELGASVEAVDLVDNVNIHAHALAYTCSIKHVSAIVRCY